jgi:hypothetical protein
VRINPLMAGIESEPTPVVKGGRQSFSDSGYITWVGVRGLD